MPVGRAENDAGHARQRKERDGGVRRPKASPGEGRLYRQPSGTWGIQGSYKGERYHVSGATQAAARAARDAHQRAIDEGVSSRAARRQTVAGILDTWLETKAPPATRYATYQRYVLAARHLADEGHANLGTWRVSDLGDAARLRRALRRLTDHGLSPRTVKYAHLALRQALALAADDGLAVPRLPRSLRPPRQEPAPVHVPPAAEVAAVLAAAQGHWRPLWTMAAHTGMRLGELLALEWADFGPGSVTVQRALEDGPDYVPRVKPYPKTGTKGIRTIPLEPDALAPLAAVPRRWTLVFANRAGAPLRKSNAIRAFKRAAVDAGLDPAAWHPHLLRHAYASHLLSQGHSVQEVSYLLGHVDATMVLKVYGHYIPRERGRASATIAAVLRVPPDTSHSHQNGLIPGAVSSAVSSGKLEQASARR